MGRTLEGKKSSGIPFIISAFQPRNKTQSFSPGVIGKTAAVGNQGQGDTMWRARGRGEGKGSKDPVPGQSEN